MNMIEEAKKQIDTLINRAYNEAAKSGSLPGGVVLTGSVEIPRDTTHGDYAATHAMAAARALKLAPMKIAEALSGHLDLSGTFFAAYSIDGPGFINFVLSEIWYGGVLQAVEDSGDDYGSVSIGEGKRVMVEFVSANPTGPMTIGNARGGVLGDTLASILNKAGYNVWREFYVNDAGNQIELFGKSIDARYMQLCLGEDGYDFPDDGYHGDDIKALAAMIYDEHGNSCTELNVAERVKKFTSIALPYNISIMKKHLERYRINFDEWFFESRLHEDGSVAETVNMLKDGGLTYEKDGALWLRNIDLGADKDEVLLRANGFYTYYAVDIAYHRNKFKRGFDKIIDVLGADHHGHTIRLSATMSDPSLLSSLGIENGSKLDFLIMQMVRLTRDGETVKISKRTGKALTLNDLLDEISVDACRFFFNAKPDSHLEFDLGLAVRQDSENPVYYVQYAHARICSLLGVLEGEGYSVPSYTDIDAGLLTTEQEHELIKQISLLPEEITLSSRDYDPSRINRYVTELAAHFHKFYNACRIKGEDLPVLMARLKLADTTRNVIRICLELLGITAPNKM